MRTLKCLTLMLIVLSVGNGMAFAQEGTYGGSNEASEGNPSGGQPTVIELPNGAQASVRTVNRAATKALAVLIGEAGQTCRKIDPDYYVDCFGERLAAIADQLPNERDYADMHQILRQASQKLRALAAENVDPQAPTIQVTYTKSNGKKEKTKPFRATKPEARKAVKAKAANVLAEAETLLLRSTDNSDRRRSHYEQIAMAVGSESKILLRSS